VARGANVNARMTKEPKDGNRNMLNRIGATPFLMAAKSDDVALMRVLLDVGADASLKTNLGTTALMAAAGVGIWAPGENPGTHEEALAAARLALEAGGGEVNDIDQEGETALHGAVYRGGAIPVIQFLLDRGAALDVVNKRGWTPLVAAEGVEYTPAVLKRYPEAADLLRRAARERPARAASARAQAAAPAATAKSIWDGAFTEGQASRGQERYRTACAACHAEDLLGAQGPALAGQAFLDRWAGSTVFDMVQVIKQSMPQEAPDSLGMPAYVDIVAYLLKNNGGPAGSSELPTEADALRQILVAKR
jgi:mono/diheme cytochrome c family protein